MSNQITLSTGDIVTIKSFVSRGTRKKINAALDISISSAGVIESMKMQNLDHSNDIAALDMIESIESNGASIKPTMAFLDGLPDADFNLIAKEINSVTQIETPKV